jgi:hypothetical protein
MLTAFEPAWQDDLDFLGETSTSETANFPEMAGNHVENIRIGLARES